MLAGRPLLPQSLPWGWQIARITDIPAGKLGVLTRLYGEDLPDGQILATEGCKGIVPDVLRPGKYRINPYAYGVQLFDAITIRPGYGGRRDLADGRGRAERRCAGGGPQHVPGQGRA